MMGIIRAVLGIREGRRLRTVAAERFYVRVGLLLLGVLLLASCRQPEGVQTGSVADTGFVVLPQFEVVYEQYGAQLLGEPITGACDIAAGGMAQYFRHVRLESTGEDQEIRFYPLGKWAREGAGEQEERSAQDYERERLFKETGYAVRDEFLDFYEAHDGEKLLGPPISPQLDEGGLRVQYFRNGRLEWHPNAVAEARVRLGSLGQAHYAQAAHDVTCDLLARPVEATAVDDVVIRAATAAPILYEGQEQALFASVSTPAGAPVRGVMVDALVGAAEDPLVVSLGRTDEEGNVQAIFDLPDFEPGQKVTVLIIAYAADGAEIGRTAHSFETWW